MIIKARISHIIRKHVCLIFLKCNSNPCILKTSNQIKSNLMWSKVRSNVQHLEVKVHIQFSSNLWTYSSVFVQSFTIFTEQLVHLMVFTFYKKWVNWNLNINFARMINYWVQMFAMKLWYWKFQFWTHIIYVLPILNLIVS